MFGGKGLTSVGLGFRAYVMLASREGNLRRLIFCSPRKMDK